MTDLADGYAAWSAADPDEVLVTPVAAGDDGTIAVVTFVGTVQQDGAAQYRADAFPVRIVDDEVVIEPFASAGDLEVVIPEAGADDTDPRENPWACRKSSCSWCRPAPMHRCSGSTAATRWCAARPRARSSPTSTRPPVNRRAYLPEGGFEPGSHTVTVAFLLAPDGDAITAESVGFEAA